MCDKKNLGMYTPLPQYTYKLEKFTFKAKINIKYGT